MRVALIGDVHANLPALEAVLAHAAGQRVKTIWNVGDFVGYGAFPDEVVTRLRHTPPDILSIVGNYDLKALRKDKLPKASDKRLAFQWAYDRLSAENRAYLQSLPQEIRLEVEGKRILLTHGSPASNDEHLTPDTPEERLGELAEMAQADVILCGHSHQPFARQVASAWFVNSGSVGRPDDGDPRACYAVLQITPKLFRARHHRVAYDVERAAAAIRERGLPEAFAQMILQGRNLDEVKPGEELMPENHPPAKKNEHSRLEAVLQLAESCHYAAEHTHQVTRLALQLFDELQSLHRLGAEERLWLQYAALLHDIGWIEGQQAHHKTALRIILTAPGLPFDTRERHIVGSIARYHRKALPDEKHDHFAALEPADRQKVRVLAGLLRVADGLDCTHQSAVASLACQVTPKRLVIRCAARQPAEEERLEALDKGALSEQVFERKLVIEWRLA